MPATFPPGTPVIFAVGTTNKAKIESVYAVGRKLFPQNEVVIFGFVVDSGVSDQPMTAEETQTGAVNRATAALDAALARVSAPSAPPHALPFAQSANQRLRLGGADGVAAHAADAVYNAVHFGVGMEGGVEKIGERYFECGWMAVAENPTNAYVHEPPPPPQEAHTVSLAGVKAGAGGSRTKYKIGLGSSARFEMSAVLMRKILHEGKELATVMDELTGETDLRSSLGAMGVLTAGHLGRAAAYEHGLLFAMAPFLSARLFWE